ncbi:ABC transporter substrate-binding protein [Paenibacillus sp. FSL L8-0436]|uniref:ABC transporter substrate-binding protein n=1 Tax=Paenibacillus sp. FSL L8-0436 TaxID=2954686 RepID=UPI00315851CA
MDNNVTHYLRVASEINNPFTIHMPIPVTIELLASVLCCTPRNVKFILRKLEEKGFIQWQAGRGRGHTSAMTFLRTVEEILENYLLELISSGKIKQAIELIGLPEVKGPLKERLLTLLNKQMGYQSETESTTGLDVLRITRNRSMEKLDPAFVYTAFEAYLIGQICSTLVTYDAVSDSFHPALAHMWEANEDHTSYIFYLRKGVRFHHGRVMISRDVKSTLQRLVELDSSALWHFRGIEEVELEGDHRIRFNLSSPNLFFLHLLSSIHMSILPFDADNDQELLGTGPYRLMNLNEDVLVLAAFDDYYSIRPLLDRVEIWYLPDQGSGARQYQLPDAAVSGSYSDGCSGNSIDYPALGCRYIIVNFRKEGIQHNPLFRQAMRLLYDPSALIRELGGNRITPADSFLPWNSRRIIWKEHSLEEAAKLLESSGYSGEEITLAYVPRKDELEEAWWLQQRAEQIGLHVCLISYKEYNMEEVKQQADFLFAEEVLEDDWQWGMINYFVNKSNHLHALLQDCQRDQLQRELEHFAELPAEGRGELLERTEAILRENCWVLYGCHMNKRAQLNQSLFGLHTGSFGFLDISRLWIKPGFPETRM